MLRLLLLQWLLLLRSISGAKYPGPKGGQWLDAEKAVLCTLDVNEAALILGHAGLAISSAAQTCAPKHPPDRALCTALVSATVASFSDVAAFLSLAASDCSQTTSSPASCGADVAGFVAAMATLAELGGSFVRVCSKEPLPGRDADYMRRLRAVEAPRRGGLEVPGFAVGGVLARAAAVAADRSRPHHDPERQAEIAQCFFDVALSASFLSRAALAIQAAVQDCGPEEAGEEGGKARITCTVSIIGVVASFGTVAQFLSFATTHCAPGLLDDAVCAGDLSKIITLVSSVTGLAMSFMQTCNGPGTLGNTSHLIMPFVVGRRLQTRSRMDAHNTWI